VISTTKWGMWAVVMLGLLATVQSRPTQAAVVTFGFDTNYSGDSAQGTGRFLTAKFADTANSDQVLLTLQANLQDSTNSEFIASLGFNVQGKTKLTALSGGHYDFLRKGIKIAGNDFDFGFDFRNRNSPNRFDGTDTISVLLTRNGLTAKSFVDDNGGGLFAAFKINDTQGTGTGVYSQSSTPKVSNPEASSLILGGMVSLLGVGYGWRRRNRTTA